MESVPTLSDPSSIARHLLHDPAHFQIQLAQIVHRTRLVTLFSIPSGSRVLEIGCGQGDCTAVLAAAVSGGCVVAVDPASPNYGQPYTLEQAQRHMKEGPLGKNITFVTADPVEYLSREGSKGRFDMAVLTHSLWYFSTSDMLVRIVEAIQAADIPKICIAEYSLSTMVSAAFPHVLSALTQSILESHRCDGKSGANIRTVLSPTQIISQMIPYYSLLREGLITPDEGLLDGAWEVGVVLEEEFEKEIQGLIADDRQRLALQAMRQSVKIAKDNLEGHRVRTMDVWWAVFGKK